MLWKGEWVKKDLWTVQAAVTVNYLGFGVDFPNISRWVCQLKDGQHWCLFLQVFRIQLTEWLIVRLQLSAFQNNLLNKL